MVNPISKVKGLGTKNTFLLIHQMKDYATIGLNLVWQRQVTFAAALALAGYYYSVGLAIVTACLIAASELYDYLLFKQILAWKGREPAVVRVFLFRMFFGTVLSAMVIVFYAVFIAIEQGPGAHFMSLFFLFAAAIFAAMNNHQVLPVLITRLLIYGATFIYIPAWDIYITQAPMTSELWAQLFTALFVLYFVIDCSRIHLKLYRDNLNKMEELIVEHRISQEAFRTKSEFLSTMSHELRTPLTSIKGAIDIMSSGHLGKLPDKVTRMLEISQRNCGRLILLIDEILDLQKIESGKMAFKMKRLGVVSLIEQTLASVIPYADRFGVSMHFDQPNIDLTVEGDQERLEQVLVNILSNAAKFSPEGSDVSVQIAQTDDIVRISIVDEGIGLSEADASKVFDRFSQLDSSITRKIGGTGLGMNISRRIMEAHGGRIDYTRNAGRGTTFFIEMKIVQGGAADPCQVVSAISPSAIAAA